MPSNDVTNSNTFSHRITPESNTGSTVARYLSCRDHHSNAGDHREPTLTNADTNITLPRMTMFTAEFYFPVTNPLLSTSFYFFLLHYLIDLHCKKKNREVFL